MYSLTRKVKASNSLQRTSKRCTWSFQSTCSLRVTSKPLFLMRSNLVSISWHQVRNQEEHQKQLVILYVELAPNLLQMNLGTRDHRRTLTTSTTNTIRTTWMAQPKFSHKRPEKSNIKTKDSERRSTNRKRAWRNPKARQIIKIRSIPNTESVSSIYSSRAIQAKDRSSRTLTTSESLLGIKRRRL